MSAFENFELKYDTVQAWKQSHKKITLKFKTNLKLYFFRVTLLDLNFRKKFILDLVSKTTFYNKELKKCILSLYNCFPKTYRALKNIF